MSEPVQLDQAAAVPGVDEIDRAFELAKSNLKRKLAALETQQVRIAHATSQLRVALAMFREDANRAEAFTMQLLAKQPPYSHAEQTEVAAQFAVAAESRRRMERIIGAQFAEVELSIFDGRATQFYSQDRGRAILAAIGVQPITNSEPACIEPNKNFANDYQRCLRKIIQCAVSTSSWHKEPGEVKIVVDFGSILPETQFLLGKLVKLEWYTDYHQCRGGKQFEDYCSGCRGCRGTEAERTNAICARCTLTLRLDGKPLASSAAEFEQNLGRHNW